MKSVYYLMVVAFMLNSFSAKGQMNEATIEQYLPGTWEIVSDDDLKVLEEGEDMFLVRSITFKENHRFGTDDSLKMGWNVEASDQIIVLDYPMYEGAVYQIETLNEKELVFIYGEKKIVYRRVE